MNDAETPATKTVEQWVYAGVRKTSKGKRDVWVLAENAGPDSKLMFFDKLPGMVGGIYDAQVERVEGEPLIVLASPTWTGESCNPEYQRYLWVKDRAAKAELAEVTMLKKAQRENPLDELLEPLVKISRRLIGAERDAFVAYVMMRIANPPRVAKK